MTLLRLVLREACAASASGPGGLSWPDFLDRHANAGVALAVCGLTLVLLLVMVGFALAAWRMGRKQGRPWSVFFGLASVGAEVPAQDSLEKLSSSVAQLEALLARIPNAGELASADAQSFEMYKLAMVLSQLLPRLTVEEDPIAISLERKMLGLLLTATRPTQGKERRASILRAIPRGDDQAMVLRVGYPSESFEFPVEFLRSDYLGTEKGLCWKAGFHAQALNSAESLPSVLAVPDVSKDPSYLVKTGHHTFRSILLAPIMAGTEVMGVVCLDSQEVNHYQDRDHYIITMLAHHLSIAWVLRRSRAAARPAA
jgi:GAF domain-containing protein